MRELPKGPTGKILHREVRPPQNLPGCWSLLPGIRHGYGFVEHTLADDGDPLGALVILDEPTFPGCLISCRAIGMFRMRVIEMGADADGIGLTLHPYPMLSETVGMAAEAFEGTITACTCRRGDSRRRGPWCQLWVAAAAAGPGCSASPGGIHAGSCRHKQDVAPLCWTAVGDDDVRS